MNMNDESEWLVLGVSIQGDNHIRTFTCNQDAIHWIPERPHQLPIILSVADGHGSQKHFRSGVGAKFSILAAEKAMLELLSLQTPRDEGIKKKSDNETIQIKIVKEYFSIKLIKKILWYWHEFLDLYQNLDIRNYESKDSGLESEIKKSSSGTEVRDYNFLPDEKSKFHQGLNVSQYSPYGSTLLTCSITDKFTIYLQLGDGNIGCVSEEGQYTGPTEDKPIDLIANETHSLISERFATETRYGFESYVNKKKNHPALIIMATDGLANAFVENDGFEKYALDIHSLIKQAAASEAFLETLNIHIAQKLPEWARSASNYSGDDITIGLIIRVSAYMGKSS